MSDLPDRRRLFALAYRMLGSRTEAEDVLQDAWLRWREPALLWDVDTPADVARLRQSGLMAVP